MLKFIEYNLKFSTITIFLIVDLYKQYLICVIPYFLYQISLPSSNSSLITANKPEMFAWPSHCDFKRTKKKGISIFLKDVTIHHRNHTSGSTAVPSLHKFTSATSLISITVGNQEIPSAVVSSGIMSLPSFVKTGVLVQKVKEGSDTYIQNRW
jgi:hypothetical protein